MSRFMEYFFIGFFSWFRLLRRGPCFFYISLVSANEWSFSSNVIFLAVKRAPSTPQSLSFKSVPIISSNKDHSDIPVVSHKTFSKVWLQFFYPPFHRSPEVVPSWTRRWVFRVAFLEALIQYLQTWLVIDLRRTKLPLATANFRKFAALQVYSVDF